ncbi:sulfite exporter TauE/SafE family protein [Dinoroseobacter sp. S76]|uniref:sulfite exporter TauE/SafE family protein n=1 Tax=Dinoroseobacter sp. S76 TaxID=3415124 RepID=UPI003C7AC8FF
MDLFLSLPGAVMIFLMGVALFAGVVKGAVGFAMPLIMMSGLSAVLPVPVALAGLILPTLVMNLWQAVRGGLPALWSAAQRHWRLLALVLVFIVLSGQLVLALSDRLLSLMIGVPIVLYAASQLAGWRLRVAPQHHRRAELATGVVAGFFGGFSGIWGPPIVAYLTALDTPKAEQVRAQGMLYGVGSVMFLVTHLKTGVVTGPSLQFSAILLAPAAIGMLIGFWLQDRMDQARFRQATMVLLLIAGLNLIRRGIM